MAGGVGVRWGAAGIQVSSGFVLALGSRVMADRWRRRSSSPGYTVTALLWCSGHRMHDGNVAEWHRCGGLARTDGLGRLGMPLLGLGMWDFCRDGPAKHCCLWNCGDGPVKHCCLWESCCCWTGGRFKLIGCTCSCVLWYVLPWASMIWFCGAEAFSVVVPGMYYQLVTKTGLLGLEGVLIGLELCVTYWIGHTGPAFWRSRSFWPFQDLLAEKVCLVAGLSCYVGFHMVLAFFGPIGVDLRSSRTEARGLFAGKAVLRAVFIVLTCLLMKPFDLRKCGEEVWCSMWWHMRNSVSSSEANGGPLSVDSDAGGPYWQMSSSRHIHRDRALLDVTLYTKGYLLKALQIMRYSWPLWVI